MYKKDVCCRICARDGFDVLLNLGSQFIANAFHVEGDFPTLSVPLTLVKCKNCHLVQLGYTVQRDLMYRNYWYRSGINETMRAHLSDIVGKINTLVDLKDKDDVVIDIAANDGTLLANYNSSCYRIAVDPSNIKPEPSSYDLFINDYFSFDVLKYAIKQKAKVITSIAMFYDLNDPIRFVRDIEACLHRDGIWVLELSYLPAMLEAGSYDTICHEHVTYYSIQSFLNTVENTGLDVFDIEFNATNGGSFKLYLAHRGARERSRSMLKALEIETANHFDRLEPYIEFAERVKKSRSHLTGFLNECSLARKTVYGYGASTKGQIIMQYCSLTPDKIVAIAERNPLKYGLFTPGTDVRICSEDEMRKTSPDYLLVFPWHFRSEILVREEKLRKAGTKLVFPLPQFEVVSTS